MVVEAIYDQIGGSDRMMNIETLTTCLRELTQSTSRAQADNETMTTHTRNPKIQR